jgi:glucarate dehydratase
LCFSKYWVGPLRRFQSLCQLAHWEGLRVCNHTHGELGIAAAAGQHLMLSIPNAIDGAQQTAAIMQDDILTIALPIAEGPVWGRLHGPGLGIEVDEDKL